MTRHIPKSNRWAIVLLVLILGGCAAPKVPQKFAFADLPAASPKLVVIDKRKQIEPVVTRAGEVIVDPTSFDRPPAAIIASLMTSHLEEKELDAPIDLVNFSVVARSDSNYQSRPRIGNAPPYIVPPGTPAIALLGAGLMIAGVDLIANTKSFLVYSTQITAQYKGFFYKGEGESNRVFGSEDSTRALKLGLNEATKDLVSRINSNRPWLAIPGLFGGSEPDDMVSTISDTKVSRPEFQLKLEVDSQWWEIGAPHMVAIRLLQAEDGGPKKYLSFSATGVVASLKNDLLAYRTGIAVQRGGTFSPLASTVHSETWSDGKTIACIDIAETRTDIGPNGGFAAASRQYAIFSRQCKVPNAGNETMLTAYAVIFQPTLETAVEARELVLKYWAQALTQWKTRSLPNE